MRIWIAAVLAASALMAGPAPPAIRPGGVVNAAGQLPQALAGGGLAPGCRIAIRGWRLAVGEKTSQVFVSQNGASYEARVLVSTEREIEAILPAELVPGTGMLRVHSESGDSLPFAVRVVDSAFQPYRAEPGAPWRPTEAGADGQESVNTREHPARPGDTITIGGSGLGTGATQIRILAGGRPVHTIHSAGSEEGAPGLDKIAFDLPSDTPSGCNVPVVVVSGTGTAGNPSLLAVTQDGTPCSEDMQWLEGLGQVRRGGLVMLLRSSMRLDLGDNRHSDFTLDASYAGFRERTHDELVAAPLYALPPEGTCVTYAGTARLRDLVSPFSILALSGGSPLSAGAAIEIRGATNHISMFPTPGHEQDYSAILGGNSPLPRFRQAPLFLHGDYTIRIPKGKDVGPAVLSVQTGTTLRWLDRNSTTSIRRDRGFTAHWKLNGLNGTLLLFAMGVDQKSGATGVCLCRARSAWGKFHVPGEALGNIPETTPDDIMPYSSVFLAALPSQDATTPVPGLDQVAAFFVASDGRTVKFR